MATNISSDSNSRASSGSDSQVLCFHDQIAVVRVVVADCPMKGRKFFCCPRDPSCGFQKWINVVDEVAELQQLMFAKDMAIGELEGENHVLRRKLRNIRLKKKDADEAVEELTIANVETMLELKNHISDKKLFVLTFLFFALVLTFLFLK